MNLEDFKVIVSDYRSYTLVEFENIKHIDLYNANELTIAFEEGEEKGAKNWVLDMSKIQFVDSSGLGVISKQARLLQKTSQKLILLNLQSTVRHLITACGLDWVFEFYSSREDLPYKE